MKLLIIEDEKDLSDSIVSYLRNEEYLCEQAFTFAEANRVRNFRTLLDYTVSLGCVIVRGRH